MTIRCRWYTGRRFLLFIFSGVVLFAWYTSQAYNEPLTVSGIMKFTTLQEGRKPKQVFIHPKWTCQEFSRKNTVIMVLSKASNRLQRETIRRTWGHPNSQMSFNFSLYFVIGNEHNVDFHKIKMENDDILHVDVNENYFKITEKVIEAMNWATQSCFDSRFFFKIDDDVYLNLIFLQEINNNEQYLPDDVILGDCVSETKPYRMSSKFRVSSGEYPFARYPPYCGGPGYAMTLQTARKLYREMMNTKTFKFEDVFVGIVAYKLEISIKNVDHFVYAMNAFFHRFYIECAIITHNLTPELITKLWNKQNNKKANKPDCSLSGKVKYALQNVFSLSID